MKRHIAILATFFSLAACGGEGGDIADRAKKAADATCACKDFECTREHMQALNKMSIKESDAVKKLSAERGTLYAEAQSKAAECQTMLRQP